MNLEELKYSEEHEWVHLDSNGLAMVGINSSELFLLVCDPLKPDECCPRAFRNLRYS